MQQVRSASHVQPVCQLNVTGGGGGPSPSSGTQSHKLSKLPKLLQQPHRRRRIKFVLPAAAAATRRGRQPERRVGALPRLGDQQDAIRGLLIRWGPNNTQVMGTHDCVAGCVLPRLRDQQDAVGSLHIWWTNMQVVEMQ